MKKALLALCVVVIAGYSKLNAQILNNSFENWQLDTFYLAANQISTLPADTVSFYDPVMWTSSNSLTMLDSVGGKVLVTQSNNAYSGNSAIEMVTDTINIPLIAHLPLQKVTIPGFVLNGIFPITSVKLNGTAQVISPLSVDGAGQPFTQRLQTLHGYYNYSPAYNDNAHSNDTCVIWATLRKGTTDVADAIFKSTTSTGGYVSFSADFNYVSCEQPDTLVILLASSVPNVANFLGGGSGLPAGSRLWVDSLTYDTLPQSHTFAPFAKNDVFTVNKNSVDSLNVLANDTDCSGSQLNVSILSGPSHGTASVLTSYHNDILYTPTTGYTGLDSIYYKDTNPNNETTQALLVIFVTNASAINEVNEVNMNLYPVPAGNVLNIRFQNPGKCIGKIYDVVGSQVISTELNGNQNTIHIESLSNGIYNIELFNEQNAVIGRSKFVVTK